ncbi:heme exporter protein CcmB [Salmonella enterica]|nr:heme exporter protein CcmB [Salmonella enterica]
MSSVSSCAWRSGHGADIAGPLWFFLMVITLFPLSVGPQPQLLAGL